MDTTEKKAKKKMSPKAKKIVNIVITSLQVAIVVVTVAISIFVWTTTGKGEASVKAMQILAIRSNSMIGDNKDSFKAGDLVVIKRPVDAEAIPVGTVITYKYSTQGGTTLITHRVDSIIAPTQEGGNIRYATKGDNTSAVDPAAVQPGDIVGVYSFKINGVGGVLLWLQGYKRVPIEGGYGWDYAGNTNNFLWVIIIPLIALLLWNGYALIKVIMEGKIKRAREEAAAAAAAALAGGTGVVDAEEIKRRAIEEYLAKLAAEQNQASASAAEMPAEIPYSAPVAEESAADIAESSVETDAQPLVEDAVQAEESAVEAAKPSVGDAVPEEAAPVKKAPPKKPAAKKTSDDSAAKKPDGKKAKAPPSNKAE